MLVLAATACAGPTAAEHRRWLREHGASDVRCPDGAEEVAATPSSWSVHGVRERAGGESLEIVYATANGTVMTWCEHTRAIWNRQLIAVARGEEPSRELWDARRQQALEREREELTRVRAASTEARRASFVPVPSAAPLNAAHLDVDSVYPEERVEPAQLAAVDSSADSTDSLSVGAVSVAEDVPAALLALRAAHGDARQPAICTARALLSRLGLVGDTRELARAEHRASRALLQELRRSASVYEELMCNDGEASPTCTCQGNRVGNFRGCCSYHHGVDGCRQVVEEPQIECD